MIWVERSSESQDNYFCVLQQTLLDNIFIVKAIQLGSTNTPENSEFLDGEHSCPFWQPLSW